MLKLSIYGYLNKTRSSRSLEKESKRSIRIIFLANVALASKFCLIGGKLIARDSTKLRAQHSKKNNFNERKIKRRIEYIDAKLELYTKMIEQNKQRIGEVPELCRKRQAIVEHSYGIIKRQWGFFYIITKEGVNRAAADVGLIFSAYNLQRIFNLIEKIN